MRRSAPRSFAAACALAAVLALAGCTERRLELESDPPGATVYVDGKKIGLTPISVPFEFYGTREFRLEKEGFQTVKVLQPVAAPIWQYFPIDFLTDVMIPFTSTDSRVFRFHLEPMQPADAEQLMRRANEVRRRARGG